MKFYLFRLGYRFLKRRPIILYCSILVILVFGFQVFQLQPSTNAIEKPAWVKSSAHILKIRWQENGKMAVNMALHQPKMQLLATLDIRQNRYQIGDYLELKGLLMPFEQGSNPNQFNWRNYYQRKGIMGRLGKVEVLLHRPSETFNSARSIQYFRNILIHRFQQLFPSPYDTRIYALVFGVEGIRLDNRWQDLMQEMGLIHAIVVSGSQVALLSGFIWLFLRLLGLPFRVRWLLMALIHSMFFVLVGGGPAVMRSMLMMHVLCLLQSLNRQSQAWRLLSFIAVLMLLMVGHYLFELGFWLSFIATASLMIWVPAVEDKWLLFLKKPLRLFLLTTLLPSFSTAIFLVIFKYTFQPWSFVANLILIPVFEWMVLLGFLLPVFSFIGLALPIAWLLLGLVYACEGVVSILSLLPFSQISISREMFLSLFLPSSVTYLVWPYLLRHVIFFKQKFRLSFRPYCCVIAAVLGGFFYNAYPKYLEVNMMDVGQGDALLIISPQRKFWLLDTGYGRYKPNAFDKSVSVILPYLRYRGVQQLEGVILSHLDADHAGGLHSLLAQFPAKKIYVSAQADITRLSKSLNVPIQRLQKGDVLNLSQKGAQQAYFKVLGPPIYPEITKKNNRSLILKLTYKDFDVLFTGDAHAVIENKLLDTSQDLKNIEVLKVGHHGSKTSSSPDFLARIKAQISLVSVGRFNRYGHPHPVVLQRLKSFSQKVFRTDKQGFIQIKSDGLKFWVNTFLKDS